MFGDKLKRYQRTYDAGDRIFKEGDWGKTIFVIKEGRVEVVKQSGRHDRLITILNDGQMVGEMILTDEDTERSATVTAKTDVVGWKFTRDQFRVLLDENQEFRDKLITTLSTRLRSTTRDLAETKKLEPVLVDLAFVLLAILDAEHWDETGPQLSLDVTHSPEFLAYRFDTSLEAMNDFLALRKDSHLQRYDQEMKEKMFKISRRIIDEGLRRVRSTVDSEGGKNKSLLRVLRRLDDDLETLQEERADLNERQFKNVVEDFKEIKEEFENFDSVRLDLLSEKFQEKFNALQADINRLYDKILNS